MTASLVAGIILVFALIGREALRVTGTAQQWSRHMTVGIGVLLAVWVVAAALRLVTLFNQAL